MRLDRSTRWLVVLVVLAGLTGILPLAPPALADEQLLWGPTSITKPAGPPVAFTTTVPVPPTLAPPFRLHIVNGDAEGNHRSLFGAVVRINGSVVAWPWDFYTIEEGHLVPVAAFDRTVVLQSTNTF